MSDQHPNVYWTADRSTLVEEGDARAAFLAYAAGDPIAPEHLELLGQPAKAPTPETPTPVAKRAPVKRATRKRA